MTQPRNTPAFHWARAVLPGLSVLIVSTVLALYGAFWSHYQVYYLTEGADPLYFVDDLVDPEIDVTDSYDGPHSSTEATLVEESTYEGFVRRRADRAYARHVLVKALREAERKACPT